MPTYITYPLETDPLELLQDIYDFLQSNIPGWEPAPGNLETWLAEAFSQSAADIRDLASQVPDAIFLFFGSSLMNIQPTEEAPASADTTWTVKDNLGYVIEAGTLVGLHNASGDLVPFETLTEITILPGNVVTATGEVSIVAVEAGADTSGLGTVGGAVELIDPLEFVTGITLVAPTSGGVDAELSDAYLDRLRTQLQLMSPRPILPQDFAVLARNIAGVYRAVAIDGLIPPATPNQERAVAIAAVDASGTGVSAPIKTAVQAYLDALREANFTVGTIDPSYTSIAVTTTVKMLAGYSATDVQARVVAALQDYLSPSKWGVPPGGSPQDWTLKTSVRYLEIAEVINRVPGVDYITTTGGNYDLTTAITGNAAGRVDIALTGYAPLPQAGAMGVTVL